MSRHIVVDANVFGHSGNPANPFFASALALVEELLDAGKIALDDTGKSAPLLETSNLYREYLDCTPPGSLAGVVIRALADRNDVSFHARPKREVWSKCKSLVPRNNNDAIVLGVGYEYPGDTVVSNDYADFTASTRKKCVKLLGVYVINSDAA